MNNVVFFSFAEKGINLLKDLKKSKYVPDLSLEEAGPYIISFFINKYLGSVDLVNYEIISGSNNDESGRRTINFEVFYKYLGEHKALTSDELDKFRDNISTIFKKFLDRKCKISDLKLEVHQAYKVEGDMAGLRINCEHNVDNISEEEKKEIGYQSISIYQKKYKSLETSFADNFLTEVATEFEKEEAENFKESMEEKEPEFKTDEIVKTKKPWYKRIFSK